ncbi:AAA family ATPase [Desulfobacterales bacterium HSG2]|nr:AAA family ATPase [Desulfobacterales bacterium HSG2]
MTNTGNTRFVTFYSYKGGVGRTLALGNMAWGAALEGKRVVIIDFDLEAPGIPSLIPFREPVRTHKSDDKKKGGLFELILSFRNHQLTPSIPDYYATKPITKSETDDFKEGGEIHIVPAGKEDANYRSKLQAFDWEKFYEKEGGREFFLRFRETIAYQFENPDLVLVDSRTGLTDIGGICTILIPDRVVVLSGLNDQNLNGCRAVMETINTHSERRKKEDYLEPVEIITVLSHIPSDEERDLTDERVKKAGDVLGHTDITLHYVPLLSLEERLLVKDRDWNDEQSGSLIASYRKLYDLMTAPYTKLEKEISEKEKESENYLLTGKYKEALDSLKELIKLCEKNGTISAGLYYRTAKLAFLHGSYEDVMAFYKEADSLLNQNCEPQDISQYDFYYDFGTTLYQFACSILSEEKEKQAITEEAVCKLRKALELSPNDQRASEYLGLSLAYCSEFSKEEKLLREAVERLRASVIIKPDDLEINKRLRGALRSLSAISEDKDERNKLLAEAAELVVREDH